MASLVAAFASRATCRPLSLSLFLSFALALLSACLPVEGSSEAAAEAQTRVVALGAPGAAEAAGIAEQHPGCRKSPEAHSLRFPDGEGLVIFGGKGIGHRFELAQGLHSLGWRLSITPGLDNATVFEGALAVDPAGRSSAVKTKRRAQFFGDTWVLHVESRQWQLVPPALVEQQPSPRWKASSTTFDDGHRMVLFGGCVSTSASGVQNDLWTLELVAPDSSADSSSSPAAAFSAAAASTFSSAASSSEASGAAASEPSAASVAASEPSAALAAASEPSEGGAGSGRRGRAAAVAALWTRIRTVNPPSARRGHVAVVNGTHLIVTGGKGYDPKTRSIFIHVDLWALPLGALDQVASVDGRPSLARTWTRGADFPGEPRWGSTGTVVEDADGKVHLAFFGGRHLNRGGGFHSVATSAYTYYGELWLYDFAADSWRLTEPPGGCRPVARDHHSAARSGGEVFIFAGRVAETRFAESILNDLWSYSLASNRWTLRSSAAASASVPGARYMPGMATLDSGHLLVFGGESLPGSTKRSSLNDVWSYSLPSGTWEPILACNCSPVIRFQPIEGFSWLQMRQARAPVLIGLSVAAALLGLFAAVGGRQLAASRRAARDERSSAYVRLDE